MPFVSGHDVWGYKVIDGKVKKDLFFDECEIIDAGWHTSPFKATTAERERLGLPGLYSDKYGRLVWRD